ncbi:hypothetical protein KP014_23190 [Paenibacillus sophorae]|uniref:Uncharacterized protein n=1 Tax=Paenibacillus sophorae TaxID=1333845 RepID=A0ABX8H9R0_9BACL|nr:hypothetical protein [Paenibacillus sophorae]QWU14798.1 hypothetical protein KP014_23190 [Paenibacillus sophorae]
MVSYIGYIFNNKCISDEWMSTSGRQYREPGQVQAGLERQMEDGPGGTARERSEAASSLRVSLRRDQR